MGFGGRADLRSGATGAEAEAGLFPRAGAADLEADAGGFLAEDLRAEDFRTARRPHALQRRRAPTWRQRAVAIVAQDAQVGLAGTGEGAGFDGRLGAVLVGGGGLGAAGGVVAMAGAVARQECMACLLWTKRLCGFDV